MMKKILYSSMYIKVSMTTASVMSDMNLWNVSGAAQEVYQQNSPETITYCFWMKLTVNQIEKAKFPC